MRPLLILVGYIAAVGAAHAQMSSPSARFVTEWSALDSSINAASLQRQHVVDAAKALIEQLQKDRAEIDYWHKWNAGERAKWRQK